MITVKIVATYTSTKFTPSQLYEIVRENSFNQITGTDITGVEATISVPEVDIKPFKYGKEEN